MIMRRGIGLVCLSVMVLAGSAFSQSVPEELTLRRGQRHLVEFSANVRTASADSSIVSLRGIGEQNLEIIANDTGRAVVSYSLRDGASGRITVTVGQDQPQLLAIRDFLNRQLQDIVGVETHVNNQLGVIEINGAVRLSRDRDRLENVVARATSQWPGQIMNNVHLDINLEPVRRTLEEALKRVGIDRPSVVAGADGRQMTLEGIAYTEAGRTQALRTAEEILQRLREQNITLLNNITVTDAIIESEFRYFFFSDSLQRDMGADLLNNLGLRAAGQGAWATGAGGPQYQAVVDIDLGKVLNILADDGHVAASRALAVRAQNGQTGSGSFGDRIIIIPRATGVGTQADYKEIQAGFRVNVTPTFISRDRVRLDLQMSVDSFGGYTGQGDATVRENQANTIIDVPLNHYAIVAVNESREAGHGTTGTPVLRRIPVVNLLFGRKSKVESTTYSGIAVVPRVVGTQVAVDESITANTDQILEQIQTRLKK